MKILILRHPREPRQPDGTVPLIAEAFGSRARVVTGLSWPNLGKALDDPSAVPGRYGVLYLGTGVNFKRRPPENQLFHIGRNKTLAQIEPGGGHDLDGLILLDGNWRQSKALWWRNAWLTRVNRFVLNPKERSRFNAIRREPRGECLSTLEACALSLEILSPRDSALPKLWVAFDSFLATPRHPQSRPTKSRAELPASSSQAVSQTPSAQ